MNARRFFTAAGVVAVAGVAGAISYRHQEHLAATHGQGSLAVVWPLCVDGLIVVTSIAISTDRAGGYRARLWALAGFWIGVLVSVTTNWLATTGGIINHAISAFPALAFLLAIESLSSKPRARKPAREIGQPPVQIRHAVTDLDREMRQPVAHLEPAKSERSRSDLPVNHAPGRAQSAAKPRAARSDSNAVRVAKTAARNPALSPVQIAARLELSEATVRRHLSTDKAPAASSAPVINGHAFADISA